MFGYQFYHRTTRRLTAAFGSLFTDIKINRYDSLGAVVQTIQVPLSYAPAQKTVIRQLERSSPENDIDTKTNIKMVLPRMSYEMVAMVYDAERARNRVVKRAMCDENGHPIAWQFTQVPYNFTFQLNVITRKTEDGLQIIEQIIPFFTPSITIPVIDSTGMGDTPSDIAIQLDDISHEDNYESGFVEQRELIWTLTFTAKGWFYFPVITDMQGLIEKIILNFNQPETDPALLWEQIVITAKGRGVTPEVVIKQPFEQLLEIDSVDSAKVITAKYIFVVEDYDQQFVKKVFELLVTHNGTTCFTNESNVMGDVIDAPISAVLEDGKMKLKAINNTNMALRFKFIRMQIEK